MTGDLPVSDRHAPLFGRMALIKKTVLIAGFIFLFGLKPGEGFPPAAGNKDEVFPSVPFRGMQVTYSLTGTELEAPVDRKSFITARIYKGVFAGNTLTLKCTSSELTGTCHAVAGDSFVALKA
jgi:hypothetical protein